MQPLPELICPIGSGEATKDAAGKAFYNELSVSESGKRSWLSTGGNLAAERTRRAK